MFRARIIIFRIDVEFSPRHCVFYTRAHLVAAWSISRGSATSFESGHRTFDLLTHRWHIDVSAQCSRQSRFSQFCDPPLQTCLRMASLRQLYVRNNQNPMLRATLETNTYRHMFRLLLDDAFVASPELIFDFIQLNLGNFDVQARHLST